MSQLLSEPIRKGAFLNLFVNRKGFMRDVRGCLGHTDHEMVEFTVLGVMRKKFSRVTTWYFERASFKLLRELFNSVSWESAFEGLGVHECWSVFKNDLSEA